MPNPQTGGSGFVFRVFSHRWVRVSTLIEALLPLGFLSGFSFP
jgi:hypothetical protein